MKKKSNFKYLRLWNPQPKPDIVITFWAILLMVSFEYLISIFYIWIPNTHKKQNKKNIGREVVLL